MPWHKITFPNSMITSGRALRIIITFSEILESLPDVNRDELIITGENNNTDDSLFSISLRKSASIYSMNYYFMMPYLVNHRFLIRLKIHDTDLLGIHEVFRNYNLAHILS